MTAALLQLRGVQRHYRAGAHHIYALRDINLDIGAGEFVALLGASGSGKSTLLNILGCLDRANEGEYRVADADIACLDADGIAALRRAHFGFVFQRYHLLPQLSALANVEVPAIYAGVDTATRQARANALLIELGLGERLDHRPNQLSGGQQQRVSIARALMNGGKIIFADEPTGALDSQTGIEVVNRLLALNRGGRTIIVATHDHAIAARADRVVEIADGRIRGDTCRARIGSTSTVSRDESSSEVEPGPSPWGAKAAFVAQLREAAYMAVFALLAHRLRTALTLLGVVIGIVSVVTMIAVGEAAQRRLAEDLKGVTTNTLEIYPGKDWGDPDAGRIQSLTLADVETLRRQTYVKDASPVATLATSVSYRGAGASAIVNGVDANYFDIVGMRLLVGARFSQSEILRQAQVVVIDVNLKRRFFPSSNPIGAILYLGKLPCVIIGVAGTDFRPDEMSASKLNIWAPYTTIGARLIGRSYFDSLVVALRDGDAAQAAEDRLTPILVKQHRTKDFMVFNLAERIRSGVAFFGTMSALLAAIGLVSLVVGGIGVMNIMLVSVAERSREIGVRIAVGARQTDIRRQFLIEAVLVCLIGAAVGVILSYAIIAIAGNFLPQNWEMRLSLSAVLVAAGCAVSTGVIFGYFPARNAAQIGPAEALARD